MIGKFCLKTFRLKKFLTLVLDVFSPKKKSHLLLKLFLLDLYFGKKGSFGATSTKMT